MSVRIVRVGPQDSALFDRIAPDVYDAPIEAERLALYLRQPGHLLVLALENEIVVGQCAGVIHLHPDKSPELYVDEVGTAATHRRRGIARLMLEDLFAWGRDQGCTEAWLGTELDNLAALGLYRRFAPTEDQAIRYFEFKLQASG